MAGSVNKVTLIGNLGKDPEVRSTQDGMKIVTFSMATSDSWKDKATGERREKTEWHRVVIFNEALANVAEKYLRKGSKLYLEGQLQTRKWVDPQGIEKYTTEVVVPRFRGELTLLDRASESGPQENWSQEAVTSTPAAAAAVGGGASAPEFPQPAPDEIDDDVPF